MEILYEFTVVGAYVRVAAVDPITGTEAIIQGPKTYSQKVLKKNAERKLMYLLEKNKKKTTS